MLRRLFLSLWLIGVAWPVKAAADKDLQALGKIVQTVCQPSDAGYTLNLDRLADALPGASFVSTKRLPLRRGASKVTHLYATPTGEGISFVSIMRGGVGLRLSTEFSQSSRPTANISSGSKCEVRQGRAIRYAATGIARILEVYGSDFEKVLGREPLNPPIPPGTDVSGVTVVHVDSGIAYDQPHLAARLARDKAGRILGTDLWDEDGLPYDADTSLSPFLVRRHGSLVADVLLKEGPPIRLVPIRYPRNNMNKFSQVVEIAYKVGAKIAALPMGSNTASEWSAFRDAAAKHPEILFVVSAGNNGRDIDARPVYPAAFALKNLLVVTSVTESGLIARGSNWGAVAVDIGVPAEQLSARDYRGRERPVAGSSFAVPRVAALAARLLAANPLWQAVQLKAAILALSVPVIGPNGTPLLGSGWISENKLKKS
jgi:subtilisin family serine protease